jgi:diguanylate cyclase (GGDEF)-like protein/PAS domain S-box-containing protein
MTEINADLDEAPQGAALAYFTSAKRGGLLAGAGPVFWVIACGAALILAIVAGTSIIVSNFRDREIQRSERELENTVQLLARHFDRQIEDFESVQKSLAAEIERRVNSPEEFRQTLSTEEVHYLLRNKISDSVDFAGVNLFDADGNFINSSERWPVPPLNLSDRRYFQSFKTGSNSGPVLIELVESRVSQGRTVVVARKISGPNGQFLGMITRSIPPDSFESFFSSVVLPNGAITLLDQDGTLLARYPHVEGAIGQNLAASPLFAKSASLDGHPTIQLVSPIDGQERLATLKKLARFPLSMVATTTVAAALSNWRQETSSLVWAAGLAAAVICLMLLVITRYLKEQHRRLDVAVNHMTQALLLFDSTERLVICNKRYLEMFGLTSDIVKLGSFFRDLVQHRKIIGSFSGDVDEYCEGIREALSDGKVSQNTTVTPDGRWMQVINRPLAEGGWVCTIEDVTERRRSEEHTNRLALYDTLTELPNRASFLGHLSHELKQCSKESNVAVLFLDTDEFKAVNDSLGHHVGDDLLRSMARNLQGSLGPKEFVARLGGDEFAVVATGIQDKREVMKLVDRIYDAIRRPHDCGNHQLTIDSSIGIALAPTDGASCDEILQNADLAMYEAKSSGRRTYRFFEAGMETKARERRLLEIDLRAAIAENQIEVHYQPIVDLHRNEIVGCEALARWKHAERGFVSPADFIPIAEQSGLIDPLGEYVLRKACTEAMTWPEHIKLAVNVSPVQFKGGVFALKVVSALAASGLAAHRLELEITEAVLIGDDEAALKVLHELRAVGVRVALDDFGTGYSSLSYLRRFPFDKIKIDRSFINGLTGEDGSSGIVRAVVAMASAHKMVTTAEGVETEEQRDMLRQLQCGEMQGFLFSAAKTGGEIRRMINAGQAAATDLIANCDH